MLETRLPHLFSSENTDTHRGRVICIRSQRHAEQEASPSLVAQLAKRFLLGAHYAASTAPNAMGNEKETRFDPKPEGLNLVESQA